jgi:hypothetical protein
MSVISSALQVFNILLLLAWVVLSIIALIRIRNINLPPTTKAIWVLIVVCVPVLGAVALFIVNPEAPAE